MATPQTRMFIGRPSGRLGAHLDTTTKIAAIPSPHDGEVGRGSERGFQKSATIRWNEPLSPLVPRREREQETSAMVVVSRCARRLVGRDKGLTASNNR